MKGDVQVTIYYGPLSWFKAQLPKGKNHKSLLVTALTEIPQFCSSKFPTLGRSAA